MSELTKNQLKTDNTNSFPNNNTGYITPSILRDFNVNMIDSLVDEVSYNVDSASFNQRISALDPSGSAAAILALEIATASLNTYTASNDAKWDTLGGKTGSYATTGSNSFIGNQTITGALTASTAQIASINYPTADGVADQFLSTDGAGNLSLDWVKTLHQNIRNVDSVTISIGTPLFVSGSTGDNANVFVADANNPLRRPATLIAYDTTLAPSATGTAIISGEIQGVDTNAYPAGTVVYLAAGGGWTATRPTGSASVQVLGVVTSQANNGRGIVFNQVADSLPNITPGYFWVGNSDSVPTAVSTSSISIDTSSFAKTNVNNSFDGTQTFNNVVVSGTASVQFLDVVYQSSSVVYSSGSNILGDASNDTQTLWGTVKLPSGPLSVTGSAVATKVSAYDFDSIFLGSQMGGTTTNGTFFGYGSNSYEFVVGAYSGPDDNELKITTNASGITFGDFNGSSYPTFLKLNPNTGTNPAPQFTRGLGVTGSVAVTGNTTLGDATSDTTTINGSTTINGNGEATVALTINSGSVEVLGPRGNGGHFYTNLPITSSNGRINGTFIAKDLIVSGTWGGEGSGSLTVEHNTILGSDYNTDTHIISGAVSIQGSLTTNGLNIVNSINSLTSATGSYAKTNTANSFTGNQTITGQMKATFDQPSNNNQIDNLKVNNWIDKYGYTIANSTLGWQRYEGTVEGWVQELYTADYAYGSSVRHEAAGMTWEIYPSGSAYDSNLVSLQGNSNGTSTFKVLADFTTITGSVAGNVGALSISSNTASLNLNNGNFFTLQLVSGSATHINPSNIKPGQTINIRVNTTGSATVTFPSSVRQASGSSYVPTAVTGEDILTLISFDSSTLYLANVKNLIS